MGRRPPLVFVQQAVSAGMYHHALVEQRRWYMYVRTEWVVLPVWAGGLSAVSKTFCLLRRLQKQGERLRKDLQKMHACRRRCCLENEKQPRLTSIPINQEFQAWLFSSRLLPRVTRTHAPTNSNNIPAASSFRRPSLPPQHTPPDRTHTVPYIPSR